MTPRKTTGRVGNAHLYRAHPYSARPYGAHPYGVGRRGHSPGFALLAALLVATLLAAIGTSFVREARLVSVGTRIDIERAQARALADAGARYAIMRLAGGHALAQPFTWRFGEGTVRLRAISEGGKLDLNHARLDALSLLFESAGLAPRPALTLARAVIAYRQSDGARAEPPMAASRNADRLVLRMSWEMDGKSFDTVDELRRVPGVTEEVFAAVADQLTVYGGLGERKVSGTGIKTAYRIVAEAETATGARYLRNSIVEFNDRGAFAIREWR